MKTFNDLLALGDSEKARMDFILQAINEHKSSTMYQIAVDADMYYRHLNPTYILATNVPYTDTESSFIAASTSSNLNAADGGLFDSRTITTDSDGILRIAARIKNGVAQPGLSSNKSKFGSGTWWLRVAAI